MTATVITTETKQVRRRRNRGRHELFLQILKAMDGGARYRTYVMYTCNLSWDQLKLYLGLLSKAGFIDDSQVEKSSGRTLYSVTDKGKEFYKAIEETQKLLCGIEMKELGKPVMTQTPSAVKKDDGE